MRPGTARIRIQEAGADSIAQRVLEL